MQLRLCRSENDNVVRIAKVIFHPHLLFHVVVEIRQIQIGEILGHVVSYRDTFPMLHAVDCVVRIDYLIY